MSIAIDVFIKFKGTKNAPTTDGVLGASTRSNHGVVRMALAVTSSGP